jgi:mono/diheme cytochrome c family protein
MLFVVVFGGFSALAAPPTKAFVLNGDPVKGEVTYRTFCFTCHGDKGEGNGPAGAALNPKPANFTDKVRAAAGTDEYIYKMVKNGGAANGKSPYMVAWGETLGDDQKVRDVAAFVRTFSKGPAKPAKPEAKPAPGKK